MSGGRIAAEGPARHVLLGPLLSEVYHHQTEVFPHPVTGEPLVLPSRQPRAGITG